MLAERRRHCRRHRRRSGSRSRCKVRRCFTSQKALPVGLGATKASRLPRICGGQSSTALVLEQPLYMMINRCFREDLSTHRAALAAAGEALPFVHRTWAGAHYDGDLYTLCTWHTRAAARRINRTSAPPPACSSPLSTCHPSRARPRNLCIQCDSRVACPRACHRASAVLRCTSAGGRWGRTRRS